MCPLTTWHSQRQCKSPPSSLHTLYIEIDLPALESAPTTSPKKSKLEKEHAEAAHFAYLQSDAIAAGRCPKRQRNAEKGATEETSNKRMKKNIRDYQKEDEFVKSVHAAPFEGMANDAYTGPFPKFHNPTPLMITEAVNGLINLHGAPTRPKLGSSSVLDSLIGTMLSQNTTDITSKRAFMNLKQACPTWEDCRTADVSVVEEAIRCCGLSQIRADRIQSILAQIWEERKDKKPRLSLEYVRNLSDAEAKAELCRSGIQKPLNTLAIVCATPL